MIDYANGGGASKELIHNDSGSVTLCSFDAGQGLREHSEPYDALIQVVDGEMELTVEGRKNVIKAGEAFVIPSGSHPSANATKRFKMMIIIIRG